MLPSRFIRFGRSVSPCAVTPAADTVVGHHGEERGLSRVISVLIDQDGHPEYAESFLYRISLLLLFLFLGQFSSLGDIRLQPTPL